MIELFDRTHKREHGKGDFIDEKSRVVNDKYHADVEAKYGSDPTLQPFVDTDVWVKAIGGPSKGRLYGIGDHESALQLMGSYNGRRRRNHSLTGEHETLEEYIQQRIDVAVSKMRADLDAQIAPHASQLSKQDPFFQEALQAAVNAEMSIVRRDWAEEQGRREADFAARGSSSSTSTKDVWM